MNRSLDGTAPIDQTWVMRVEANGVELEVEVEGEGEPLLLIMGIGAQLVHWPDPFVQLLARAGFQVIRFDNRDAGRSTRLVEAGAPPPLRTLLRGIVGWPARCPYTLSDMAADSAAVLDALGHESAHVVGASMGGMIAQMLAVERPARVRSLVSMMSTTGHRRFLGSVGAMMALLGPSPRTRDEAAARTDRLIRSWGSPGYPRTDAELDQARERARHAFDRAPPDPGAFARQFAAICFHGDRAPLLRAVRAPTLVLHGACDPLIPPAAGRGTAQAIPGAELRILDGMGHDLPPGLWPVLVEAIAGHARRAAPAATADAATADAAA